MNLQEIFTHIHYVPEGFYRCKNLHFLGGKWERRGCGSRNGPLSLPMALCLNLSQGFFFPFSGLLGENNSIRMWLDLQITNTNFDKYIDTQ